MYGDLSKASGRVRIPIDRAMELYAQEAGRASFYPAKATAPKKDDACRPLTPKS
jgi:stringent starvation protein B